MGMSKKALGVYGGVFDPFHNGHLAVINAVVKNANLEKVLVLPAGAPPMRNNKPQASIQHRINMAKLALADVASAEVSERDASDKKTSYTVDLLEALKLNYPQHQLNLILGADAAEKLPRWKNPNRVQELATILVIDRLGTPPNTQSIGASGEDASSTRIRHKIGHCEPVEHLVPPKVYEYIKKNRLYNVGKVRPEGSPQEVLA